MRLDINDRIRLMNKFSEVYAELSELVDEVKRLDDTQNSGSKELEKVKFDLSTAFHDFLRNDKNLKHDDYDVEAEMDDDSGDGYGLMDNGEE